MNGAISVTPAYRAVGYRPTDFSYIGGIGELPMVLVVHPDVQARDIRELAAGPRHGFGSIRVKAAIGESKWATSIFPDSTNACYVLPVKKAIRKAEGVEAGDTARVALELIDF